MVSLGSSVPRLFILARRSRIMTRCTDYRRCFSTTFLTEDDGHCDEIPSNVEHVLQEYCEKQQTSSSIQMLMKTGRGEMLGKTYKNEAFMGRLGQQLATNRILIQFASFLSQEIPIRLAHRIRDLDQVPILRDMHAVQQVKAIYIRSFLEMIDFPPILNSSDEVEFANMLGDLYTKHSGVLVQMAKGAYELREGVRSGDINVSRDVEDDFSLESLIDCHRCLDRFYMSRIGIRVLAGQYLAMRQEPQNDYIGMICQKTSPSAVVREAAANVTKLCIERYGRAPEVQLIGRLDLTFPYIPTYLHYIVLELLKNALRATCEKFEPDAALPPVVVVIADGTNNEDVVIKITDEGGGIPRSQIEKIWSYLYTTAGSSLQKAVFSGKDHSDMSPMAGLGYGLPISRSYARYFGGDIDLMSMDGHGTDVFVYLKRLGDTKEPIPV